MHRKLAFVAAVAAIATLLGITDAHADQIEPADRDVNTVRVTYVEPMGRVALYVELNNGATYRLRPCIYEDGSSQPKGCFWDAGNRGNHVGDSFVVLPRGEFVYSVKIGNAR